MEILPNTIDPCSQSLFSPGNLFLITKKIISIHFLSSTSPLSPRGHRKFCEKNSFHHQSFLSLPKNHFLHVDNSPPRKYTRLDLMPSPMSTFFCFHFQKKKYISKKHIRHLHLDPNIIFHYTNIAKTILKFNVNRADTQNFEITFISQSSNSSQNTFLQILKLKNVPLHYEQKLVLVFLRRSLFKGCQHV